MFVLDKDSLYKSNRRILYGTNKEVILLTKRLRNFWTYSDAIAAYLIILAYILWIRQNRSLKGNVKDLKKMYVL